MTGAGGGPRLIPQATCTDLRSSDDRTTRRIGLGIGLAIAIALLPLSQALNGGLPYAPARPFAAILGISALLALLALALPARRALRARPVEAIGARE